MRSLTEREQHFLVQAYYKKSFTEMLALTGIAITKLFKQIPDEVVQYFLDN